MHTRRPVVAPNLPAGHARHTALLVPPMVVLYLPAAQFVQPATALVAPPVTTNPYVPAGHPVHVTVPVVAENLPVGHAKHADKPTVLYLPAAHARQVPVVVVVDVP